MRGVRFLGRVEVKGKGKTLRSHDRVIFFSLILRVGERRSIRWKLPSGKLGSQIIQNQQNIYFIFYKKSPEKRRPKQTPKEIIYKTSPNISSSDWAVPQLSPCYPLDHDVSQLEGGVKGGGDPLNKYTAPDGPTVRPS